MSKPTLLDTTHASMLSAAALSAAAASRTMTITLGKAWVKLRLRVAYTYAAATSVTLTSTVSLDGTNYTTLNVRVITTGVAEGAPLSDVETGTASFDRLFDFDVTGLEKFKVVFSGAGSPTAGDLITTQAMLIDEVGS